MKRNETLFFSDYHRTYGLIGKKENRKKALKVSLKKMWKLVVFLY